MLHAKFEARLACGAYFGALTLVSSEHRIPTLRAIWPRIPVSARSGALADSIRDGDLLAPHLVFLVRALRAIRKRGERVFDGAAAQERFALLPDPVTAYRGTVQAEVDDAAAGRDFYGISWTLDRSRALFFATEHHRFRNTSSPPVLLTVSLARDDIAGLLFERDEVEVLLDPRSTIRATSQRV